VVAAGKVMVVPVPLTVPDTDCRMLSKLSGTGGLPRQICS
jgi:hypothetical protein